MTLPSTDAAGASAPAVWNDPSRPVGERVQALVAAMNLEEKVAQLGGLWVGASDDGEEVAPHQHDMEMPPSLDELLPAGLGQLTRPFGSRPVDPAQGALSLVRTQERIRASNRFGIPAVAHDECLAGFAAWGATAYPVPLSWGATFDPALIERMAGQIGRDMRSVGVHQGLAPVLDVVRDARWGRVEETIGEDPYLVGAVGAAYVRGLESAGLVATLKHFAGYSASRAGRNLAPVSMGPREVADVILPPFEMALLEGGARSVMNAYTDIDGIPSAADPGLLTDLLRGVWGFEGTVVADYFAVAFLHRLHAVAGSLGEAAGLALDAGIDVELPTIDAYRAPLLEALRAGRVPEEVVDRALRRVLAQKIELGLLDPGWSPVPAALKGADLARGDGLRGTVDLDPAENRALARTIAEEAVVLVRNDGVLPLDRPGRIAVLGPNAADSFAVLGCYSFPAHIGVQHPESPLGIELPTLLDAVREEFPGATVEHHVGTTIDGGEEDGIPEAVRAAREADVVLLALGDRAGLFGRGTSGEGCDVETLELPGAQRRLLEAVLDVGTPVVLVMLSGRPYALGRATTEAAAILQTFFPGEEGARAIASVLSGRVNPSGRLPIGIPSSPGGQPSGYLAAPRARASGVSNLDPTPAYPFGHGLGFSSFAWDDLRVDSDRIGTDGTATVSMRVRNTGERKGVEVVQLYLHDPVASVVRPVQRLIGFTRVPLDAGASATVRVSVPADLTSFTGRTGERIVEPGAVVLGFGRSSADIPLVAEVELEGPVRVVDHRRSRHPGFEITP